MRYTGLQHFIHVPVFVIVTCINVPPNLCHSILCCRIFMLHKAAPPNLKLLLLCRIKDKLSAI